MRIARWELWLCLALLSGSTMARAAEEVVAPPQAPDPVERIVQSYGLDAKQEAAYRVYLAAVANRRPKQPALTEDQIRAMSLPDRTELIANRMAEYAEANRANAADLRRLYGVLTASQRQSFDSASLSPPGKLGLEAGPNEPPVRSIADVSLPAHTNPDWLIKPGPNDLQRVYPYRAWKLDITGQATMQCDVDDEGFLFDCTIISESPKEMGFGNAALEVSAYMRMKPATIYGVPVSSSIVVPVSFAPSK